MKLHTWLLPLVLIAGTAAPVRAEAPIESAQQSWLIDNTRSDLGGEFFRAFAGAWRREARGDLVISVEERMGAQFSHQISIWVGNRLLAQTRFYPGQRASVDRLAESTAAAAQARLVQWLAGTAEVM